MKLVSLYCPSCGARLDVDMNNKTAACQYCGAIFPIDDEKQSLKIDGAEQAGYEFEKGRQRAQAEALRQQPVTQQQAQQPLPKKRKTWLWVLGWLCIFPVPLTIIMLRKKSMDARVRYGIIAAGWLVYLAIGLLGGCGKKAENKTADTSTKEMTEVEETVAAGGSSQEIEPQDKKQAGYDKINKFIDRFEASTGLAITDRVQVDNISDKDSGYYRTAYRLGPFQNAVGVIGQVDGYGQIDIISYGGCVRVYADVQDKEQAAFVFESIANILVTGSERDNISKCVEEIEKYGSSSSLYLGPEYSAAYVRDEVFVDASGMGFSD